MNQETWIAVEGPEQGQLDCWHAWGQGRGGGCREVIRSLGRVHWPGGQPRTRSYLWQGYGAKVCKHAKTHALLLTTTAKLRLLVSLVFTVLPPLRDWSTPLAPIYPHGALRTISDQLLSRMISTWQRSSPPILAWFWLLQTNLCVQTLMMYLLRWRDRAPSLMPGKNFRLIDYEQRNAKSSHFPFAWTVQSQSILRYCKSATCWLNNSIFVFSLIWLPERAVSLPSSWTAIFIILQRTLPFCPWKIALFYCELKRSQYYVFQSTVTTI